jgi:hypothetical protein
MVQIDRGETRWGGFLVVDEDAVGLTELVGGQRAGAAYDLGIIEEAWRARRTIVSSHGDDLVRAIGEFQRREDGRACCDLRGLLIIPSDALVRDRALLPQLIRDGVDTPAGRFRWPAIGYLNLCLTVDSAGAVTVRRFARCSHCNRDAPIRSAWYNDLPFAGVEVQDVR